MDLAQKTMDLPMETAMEIHRWSVFLKEIHQN